VAAEVHGRPACELFCLVKGVAWDFAQKRPVGFLMQTADGEMAGGEAIAAFTWYETAWALGTHESADALLDRPVDVTDPDSFDPETDGLSLITAQRCRGAIDITPGVIPGFFRIGGEIHLTEIRKTGVQVFAIGDFPDRVGELIDPATTAAIEPNLGA
jgi:hypothetical protein